MPPLIEINRNTFDYSTVVSVLEREAQPQLPVTVLAAYGSVNTSDFDRKGAFTSDVDLIAVTPQHFESLSLPNWTIHRQTQGIAQARGILLGREIHLYVSSERDLTYTLDLLVSLVEKNTLNMDLLTAWSYIRRIRSGQVVYGRLPDHKFYGLLDTDERFRVLNKVVPLV